MANTGWVYKIFRLTRTCLREMTYCLAQHLVFRPVSFPTFCRAIPYTTTLTTSLKLSMLDSSEYLMCVCMYSSNVVQDFGSDSSFYCYRPVSYGQQVTTLIRQHQRMTGKFKCWRLNTNTNSCYGADYCVTLS